MNEAIATIGSNALVLDTNETVLTNEISAVEENALRAVVSDDASYEMAAEYVKEVKRTQKRVTDYWEPLRVDAKKSYDNVLARKKEMLSPLESAEKILRGKIDAYLKAKEEERRRREEEMRRLAREEMERKLEEAARAEAKGDAVGAEFAIIEAEIMDDVYQNSKPVEYTPPKAKGVSVRKDWEITGIDPSKVPVEIAGAVIRPVDEKLVLKLIRATKGAIEIPGIRFEEKVATSYRA